MKKQQHTLAFIKRQAKNLKKKSGISHTKALDSVVEGLGYSNWKHCLRSIKQQSVLKVEVVETLPQLSFTDWLKRHRNRNSPLGDLASDMLRDSTWPSDETLEKYLEYIKFRSGSYEVIETLKRAWKAYKACLRRKKSPKSNGRSVIKQRPKNHDTRKIVFVYNVTGLHYSKRKAEKFAVDDKAWISWNGRKAIPVTIVEVDSRHYSVKAERPLKRAGEVYSLFLEEVASTPELSCINYVT